MAIFVIVHGAFGGGWEWTGVAASLRAVGHAVFTPTLTGMGERAHLGPEVGLSTHVQDVVGVLEFEDLWNVVLCGTITRRPPNSSAPQISHTEKSNA